MTALVQRALIARGWLVLAIVIGSFNETVSAENGFFPVTPVESFVCAGVNIQGEPIEYSRDGKIIIAGRGSTTYFSSSVDGSRVTPSLGFKDPEGVSLRSYSDGLYVDSIDEQIFLQTRPDQIRLWRSTAESDRPKLLDKVEKNWGGRWRYAADGSVAFTLQIETGKYTLRSFDLDQEKVVSKFELPSLKFSVSPVGNLVASWPANAEPINIYNSRTGELTKSLKHQAPQTVEAYFSADERTLLQVHPYGFTLFDIKRGKATGKFPKLPSSNIDAAYAPSGKAVLSNGIRQRYPNRPRTTEELLALWDTKTGKPIAFFKGPLENFVFSPDGSQVAGRQASTVTVFEIPEPLQKWTRAAVAERREPVERRAPQEPQVAESRTWTSADGQFRIDARLQAVTDTHVVLVKSADGEVIRVPLAQVSEVDREYLRGLE